MAEFIRFSFNDRDAQRALDALGKRAPVAIVRALNRTAGSVRTVMSREVSRDIGLKVGTVRDEVKIRPAREDRLVADVNVSGARIALEKFGGRGPLPSRGRGKVSAATGRQRKQYQGFFRARMSSGHVGIFERKATASGRKSRGAWGPNLPIQEKFGPSLPHVFGKHIATGIARGEEQLAKNLEHEIGFELSRSGGA